MPTTNWQQLNDGGHDREWKLTEKHVHKIIKEKHPYIQLNIQIVYNRTLKRIQRKFETRSFGANILPEDWRARLTCFWIAHKAQNPAIRPSKFSRRRSGCKTLLIYMANNFQFGTCKCQTQNKKRLFDYCLIPWGFFDINVPLSILSVKMVEKMTRIQIAWMTCFLMGTTRRWERGNHSQEFWCFPLCKYAAKGSVYVKHCSTELRKQVFPKFSRPAPCS